jgi:ssDNA-binding Zn-finger/Zn-ribbon topoisomerase 1
MIDRFTKREFEDALPKDKDSGENLWEYFRFDKGEHTYIVPVNENVAVMIRSSVNMDGVAAESGADSIRLYLMDVESEQPLAKKVDAWTQRTVGWQDRMIDKIRTLYKKGLQMVTCPKCGKGRMVERDGRYGTFYGCSNYPKCRHTVNSLDEIEEQPEDVNDEEPDFGAIFDELDAEEDFNFVDDDYIDIDIEEEKEIKLNSQQQSYVEAPVDANIRVMASPGSGKCLAPGTQILLYSGEIIKVEDVKIGMQVMGPDSKPRTVLSLGHGYENMYDIIPTKGDKFTVNESHILSLNTSGDHKLGTGNIVNISLRDYFELNKTKKHHLKLWRTGVNFDNNEDLELDPYILGLWLGDGDSNATQFTSVDIEVIDAFVQMSARRNLLFSFCKRDDISCRLSGDGWRKNSFWDFLRDNNLFGNKHIPHRYKTASREDRLQVLAGLMDTDGHLDKGCFDYVSKSETLANDVVFVTRSLGFAAYIKEIKKCCMYKGEKSCGIYYRVYISGDVDKIPTRIPRKKAEPRKQKKRVTVTGFTVTPIGVGEYYGFTVDGDGLFLLGDFTVTHNTATTVRRIEHLIKHGVDPNAIVYVTLTKTMADEGFERIAKRVPQVMTSNLSKQVCTIHALCYRMLRWEGITRDVPKEWQVKKAINQIISGDDREHLRGEWQHELTKPGYKEVLYWIDLAKSNGFTKDKDLQFYTRHMTHALAEKVHNARNRFDEWLEANNYITFVDMLFMVEQLLINDPDFRKKYQAKFTHVLVDEFQDTNAMALKILITISLNPGDNRIYDAWLTNHAI